MSVYIENTSGQKFNFHYRVITEKAVKTVMEEYRIPDYLDVNIMIVSADEIKRINCETRDKDEVTDVLSFPYFEFDHPGCADKENISWSEGDILGDIVLCAEKIISQAEEYGHSQKREMAFLTVHSMLHLLGYDHMKEKDAALMEERQEFFMNRLGISR